jgi:hypothetical protein
MEMREIFGAKERRKKTKGRLLGNHHSLTVHVFSRC